MLFEIKAQQTIFTILILSLFSILLSTLFSNPILKCVYPVLFILLGFLMLNMLNKANHVTILKFRISHLFMRITAYSLSILLLLDSIFGLNRSCIFATAIIIFLRIMFFSFISGYLVLKVCKCTKYFSQVENFLISFGLSFVMTGFVTLFLALLNFDAQIIYVMLSAIILTLLTVSEYRNHIKHTRCNIDNEFHINALQVITFLILGLFYLTPLLLIFPKNGINPGCIDQVYHYRASINLLRNIRLYLINVPQVKYILSNAYVSMIIFDVDNPILPLSLLAPLTFIVIIAFYSSCRVYLKNSKQSLISTIMFTLFSGYSWLHYLSQLLNVEIKDQFYALQLSSYKLPSSGGFIWIWGLLPETITFALFFIGLAIIGKKEIPLQVGIPLVAMMILGSCLSHPFQGVFFVYLLIALMLFTLSTNLKCIVFIIIIISSAISSAYFTLSRAFIESFLSILAMGLTLVIFFVRKRYDLNFLTFELKKRSFFVAIFLLLMYLFSTAILLSLLTEFYLPKAWGSIYAFPWYLWLPSTGLIGLLAIVGIYVYMRKTDHDADLSIFALMTLLAFLAGKTITIINTYLLLTYYEYRCINFFVWGLIPFASVGLSHIYDFLEHTSNKRPLKIKILKPITLGLILLLSTPTILQRTEYWIISSEKSYQPSQVELSALSYLKECFDKDREAYLLTVTDISRQMVSLSGPPQNIFLRDFIWNSKTPEIVAYALSHKGGTYIYLHQRDKEYVTKYYSSGYMSHLLSLLEPVFHSLNENISIYKVPQLTPPKDNSDVALVVPSETSLSELYYGYDMMMLSNIDYTIVREEYLPELMDKRILIYPIDPLPNEYFSENFEDKSIFDKNWNIISGNWNLKDGYCQSSSPELSIILTKISAHIFKASFDIIPLKGKASKPLYMGFVLYNDKSNYDIIWMHFNIEDKRIYVWPIHYVNGGGDIATYGIKWPGISTEMDWSFGKTYKISLLLFIDLISVSINGKQFQFTIKSKPAGKIGLATSNIYEALFDNLTLTNLGLRFDYTKFIENGGTMIILNSNGYHDIGRRFFEIELGNTFISEIIDTKNSISININEMEIQKIQPADEEIDVLAWYSINGKPTVPFIVKNTINHEKLLYVNIYPLLAKSVGANDLLNVFSNIHHLIFAFEKKYEKTIDIGDAITSKIEAKGNVIISSNSISITALNACVKIQVNESEFMLTADSLQLSLFSHLQIKLEMLNFSLEDGLGPYIALTNRGGVTITSDNATYIFYILQFHNMSAETLTFENKKINGIIKSDFIILTMRHPKLEMSGSIIFKAPQIFDENLRRKLLITGSRDAHTEGTCEVCVMMASDKYIYIKILDLQARTYSISPEILYEWRIPSHCILYTIPLLLIFLILLIIYHVGNKEHVH